MKLQLPQVTLIAMAGVGYKTNEHYLALDKYSELIDFGDKKLVINDKINNVDDWNREVVFSLGDYVDTDYALLVHLDGGVANPYAWDDKWLEYDFIGSPFPMPTDDFSYRDVNGKIQRVGNSVSLRSKKLMQLPKKIGMEWKAFHGFFNEDGYISVNMRHIFEEHGCKYAPFEEAVKFGMEYPLPDHEVLEKKPFVYHKNMGFNSVYPNFEL